MKPCKETIGFLLHDAARLLKRDFERRARSLGLTRAQWQTLFHLARFRLLARNHGLTDVALQGKNLRFSTIELPDSKQLRLSRHYPDAHYKQPAGLISVPRPTTSKIGGKPLEGLALLQWCADLIKDVIPEAAASR